MIDFLKQAVGFQINLKGFLGIMIGKRTVKATPKKCLVLQIFQTKIVRRRANFFYFL
jgi:hypothetical protein